MMTAHVVYPALDDRPATMAKRIATDLLRTELGFGGVLFSDDLEMKAILAPAGEAAVDAVAAGCDVLLVCSRADLASECHEALVREAEKSPAFRARCEEAYRRALEMRRRVPGPRGTFTTHDDVARELASRLG
jgi:beta-N-acetylhexosaminidase